MTGRIFPRLHGRNVAVWLIVAASGHCACAQLSGELLSEPPTTRNEVADFCANFDVEGEMRSLIFALHEDNQREYQLHWSALQAKIREARAREQNHREAHPEVLDPWIEEGLDFGRRAAQRECREGLLELQQQFEDDVEMILDGAPLHGWRAFRRAERRQRILPHVESYSPDSLAGNLLIELASIDLDADEKGRVSTIAPQYESDLDKVLAMVERDLPEVVFGEPFSPERHKHLIDSVRSLNEKYVKEIASLLSAHRLEFESLVRGLRYPALYTESPVDRAVSGLLQLERLLSEDERQQVEALHARYVLSRESLRRRFLRAHRKWMDEALVKARRSAREEHIRRRGEGETDRDPEIARIGHPGIEILTELLRLEERTTRALRRSVPSDRFEQFSPAIRVLLTWDGYPP